MAWCQKLKFLFTHFRKLLRSAFAREYKIHLKLITCNLSAWTDLGFFRNRPRLKLFWIFWLISAIAFPSDHIFCLFLVLISILKIKPRRRLSSRWTQRQITRKRRIELLRFENNQPRNLFANNEEKWLRGMKRRAGSSKSACKFTFKRKTFSRLESFPLA